MRRAIVRVLFVELEIETQDLAGRGLNLNPAQLCDLAARQHRRLLPPRDASRPTAPGALGGLRRLLLLRPEDLLDDVVREPGSRRRQDESEYAAHHVAHHGRRPSLRRTIARDARRLAPAPRHRAIIARSAPNRRSSECRVASA